MENVMEVQRNIKDNAEEVNDFLKDLDNWSVEMEEKDRRLREQKLHAASSGIKSPEKENQSAERQRQQFQSIPMQHKTDQPRKDKTEKKKKKSKEDKNETSKDKVVGQSASSSNSNSINLVPSPPKKDRIKAYEYDKWDKLDIEEECRKIDAELSESSSEDDEAENAEDERLKQQAVAERERGNLFFKQGKFDKAIERYTAGMQNNPYCPLLPANRAMALLKKEQYGAAEQDASLSLSLDPTYAKALQRRASARIGLGKLEGAVQDYEQLLRLEPANQGARKELEKLQAKLAAEKEQEPAKEDLKHKVEKISLKDNMKAMFKHKPGTATERLDPESETPPSLLLNPGDPGKSQRQAGPERLFSGAERTVAAPWAEPDPDLGVEPVHKPPHLRSKKPLQRIEITGYTEKIDGPIEIENLDEPLKPLPGLCRRIQIVDVDGEPQPDIAEIQSEVSPPSNGPTVPLSDGPSVPPMDGPSVPLSDGPTVLPSDGQTVPPSDGPSVPPSDGFRSKSTGFCRRVEMELNEPKPEPEPLMASVPPVPKTSAQFYRDWRQLKDPQSRQSYIVQFSRESYPRIFKSQMDSQPFSEILSVLAFAGLSPADAAEHLRGLVKLPRISALSLFLAPLDQEYLRTMVGAAEPLLSEAEVETIRRTFSI